MTRLLLIAGQDSYNHTLPPLAAEAARRGWAVDILTQRDGADHAHMFAGLTHGAETPRFLRLGRDEPDYARYAVAVGENLGPPALRAALARAGVPRLSMAFHNLPREYVLGPAFADADAVCCLSDAFADQQRANGVRQCFAATGSPQYDGLDATAAPGTDVLFLEQHFYPAGDAGKDQLAEMLVAAARRFPHRRIVVKPRSLPGEEANAAHKAEHLYPHIHALDPPQNLILLDRHLDLVKLVAASAIVATTFSTALTPAVYLGRPVLFVEGFDTEDTEFYSQGCVEAYYRKLRETGCVIGRAAFADALAAPPAPDREALARHFGRFDGHAARRILDVAATLTEIAARGLVLPPLTAENGDFAAFLATADAARNPAIAAARRLDYAITCALERFYVTDLRTGLLMRAEFAALRDALEALRAANAAPEDAVRLGERALEDAVERLLASGAAVPQGFPGWYVGHLRETGRGDRIAALPARFDGPDRDLHSARIAAEAGDGRQALRLLDRYLGTARRARYRHTPALTDGEIARGEALWTELFGCSTGDILAAPEESRRAMLPQLARLGCQELLGDLMDGLDTL